MGFESTGKVDLDTVLLLERNADPDVKDINKLSAEDSGAKNGTRFDWEKRCVIKMPRVVVSGRGRGGYRGISR